MVLKPPPRGLEGQRLFFRSEAPGLVSSKKPLSLERYSLAMQPFPFSPETIEPFRILH